ncbi:MAG: hypothetical protein KGQ28_02690, partial [Hyphomicrobiales bacterium]|nr:hypothetical protein [Hyphomicrobiales bacterium]
MADANGKDGDGEADKAVETAAADAPNRDRRPRHLVIEGEASETGVDGASAPAAEAHAGPSAKIEPGPASGDVPDASRADDVAPPVRPSRAAPILSGGLAGALVAGLVALGAPLVWKPAPTDDGVAARLAKLEAAPSPAAAT